jgi:hypothetical protein
MEMHLWVPTFDVTQGALRELGQLFITHRVHRGGSRLPGQCLHLWDTIHEKGCLDQGAPKSEGGKAKHGCKGGGLTTPARGSPKMGMNAPNLTGLSIRLG